MANRKHVAILAASIESWNTWRDESPKTRPDLIGAKLRGACLHHAEFGGANLGYADLSDADLGGADLSDADLRSAELIGANLRNADLSGADLTDADLRGADLRSSVLRRTDFGGADLRLADFDRATLWETLFVDVDLSGARNLGSCRFDGPSTVDHRTLARSGTLPLAFLQGCGLPETLIEYLPSLLSQPIQFYSCFISYSSKDRDFAERLHADLQNKGVRCWFAPEDLKIGSRIRPSIDEQIRVHDKLLLVLSENSIASDWVEHEVESALAKERQHKEQGREDTVLFPVRLDESVMDSRLGWAAHIKNTRHIGDFTRWKDHDAYKKALSRLMRDLNAQRA